MRIVTTSLCYPSSDHPEQGAFVQRRAEALAVPASPRQSHRPALDVRVIAPTLWCPLLRHGNAPAGGNNDDVLRPRMLSIPGPSWILDGIAYAAALQRAIRRMTPRPRADVDLIDAHFVYPDGVGALLAGRRLGIPVSVTVRGKIVSLSRRTLRRLQIAWMLRRVDARIAVSRSLADWVHRIAGCDLHVDVIPNGVDPRTFHLVDDRRARSILGWHERARYVLAVGHLQRLKGFDRIVQTIPAIRAACGDVRLVLAGSRRGEPRFRRELERSIEAVNRAERTPDKQDCIRFIGPVDPTDLNLMYNAADVMVNASRSEGWNNAITESFAAGTPVVATDVGGNPEQVCSSELGTIVPDGNQDALTQTVIDALSRTWNRPLISAHGCARTWPAVADEVHAVFARVLATRRRSLVAGPTSERATAPSAPPAMEVRP